MTEVYGDPDLAAHLSAVLGPRHQVAAVAEISSDGVRIASLGAALSADFEIGSVSKAVTGLLYAHARDCGEISAATTVGELLPVSTTPLGTLRLAALSTHRSGLPRLAAGTEPLRRTIELWRHGTNPYGEDLETLLEHARRTRVGRPRPLYSNLGFELLGHALAQTAGVDYPTLVHRRLVEPLGLSTFYAPATANDLRATALTGRSRRGRPRAPWTGAALAPAGGLRASITDMAALAQALVEGTAPGSSAMDPVAQFSRRVMIGAAWITLPHHERQITWHNGGTGGFRSWIGLDRERHAGLALLTATSAPIDHHGFRMLEELTGRH